MNIAICDDEKIFRKCLRELLVKDNFAGGADIRVEEFESGEALLNACEKGTARYDILFLDIRA